MPSNNLQNLKSRLNKAAAETDPARRGIRIAAVISEALQSIGQKAILVGGAAVEYYTEGKYATGDIDMIAFGGKELWTLMAELGFEKQGKNYIHQSLQIYIEFPSEAFSRGEKIKVLDIDGVSMEIIAIEDLIVDRLCAYKFWGSGQDGVAVILLLESQPFDKTRLLACARKENVLDALEAVQTIYQEVFRKKIDRKTASQKLQGWLQQKNK